MARSEGQLTTFERRFVDKLTTLGDPALAAVRAGSRSQYPADVARITAGRPRVYQAIQARIAARMVELAEQATGVVGFALTGAIPHKKGAKPVISMANGLRAAELVIKAVHAGAASEGDSVSDRAPRSAAEIHADLEALKRTRAILEAVDVDPFEDEIDPFDE